MGRVGAATTDIVICIHEALEHVRQCLRSVDRHTDAQYRLLVVDDGSSAACHHELVQFSRSHPRCFLIRNARALGYTKAANQGLQAARADLVVLLNSDTVVTAGWLERIQECAASDSRIGIVGPLSNAAGYQSVPEVFGADGDWSHNAFPPGWGPDEVAGVVATIAPRTFPRVALVNGFCIAIKRSVIDAIGYFDEASFPDAYGEEYDYCLRAVDAGFELVIADHAYVYHAQAQSYSDARHREILKRAGTRVLLRKHGRQRLRDSLARLYDEPTLAAIRIELGRCLQEMSPPVTRTSSGPP